LALTTLSVFGASDVFKGFDKDANQNLDKKEFLDYLTALHKSIDPLIDISGFKSNEGEIFNDVHDSEDKAWVQKVLSMTNEGDFVASFCNSLAVILITEIGDKTFFIAAVLAMRNGRFVVYAGAMLALALMHILSSLMGIALPALLPKKYTHFASAILFLYFGGKLLKDAADMKGEGPSEELQEVEEELINKKTEEEHGQDIELQATSKHGNSAEKDNNNAFSSPTSLFKSVVVYLNLTEKHNLEVFTQAFTLTFLAEWGDRSQIATIALASVKNPFGVVLGGLLGHAFCTGVAVIGGRMLAAKISERTVAWIGGFSFLGFGIHSFIAGP